MDPIIIDDIPFQPNYDQIASHLKVKPGSSTSAELKRLLEEAQSIARPRAMYKVSSVEARDGDSVLFDGRPFNSRLLCINLKEVHRSFPYVATCGIELHEWAHSFHDSYTRFFADFITSTALQSARVGLFSTLTSRYNLGKTATMNPGSLEDWPLQAQIPLFSLLGDPGKAINVRLTESLLMIPRQSVSGILFETEKDYVNCQLCPRDICPNRRAKYDHDLHRQYQPQK
jgi:hypothetical protein